jgi:hypothetical protein
VNTVEAGLPRPSGRTEKRAGAARDEHPAVEGHTQSLRPERADCPLFTGLAPKPNQTIDLKARPHLRIGSRRRSGLLRRKTTGVRETISGSRCGARGSGAM